MYFEKPEMAVVEFDAADIIVTSGMCTNDCNEQGCQFVCTGNTCVNSITCDGDN